MANCFYHDSIPAAANCARCGMPMCISCLQTVANKPVCTRCVDSVKAQVQAEIDRNPQMTGQTAQQAPPYQTAPDPNVQPNPYAQPNPYSQQSSYNQQPYTQPGYQQQPVEQYRPSAQAAKPSANNPGMLALGTLAAIVVGMIGALIWEKVTFYSSFNIGYLTALIGFGVGMTIVAVSRQGGIVPGICGGVISLLVQIAGYYMLACDEVAKDIGHAVALDPGLVFSHLGEIVGPFGWVILAIGVWGGFNTPMRAAHKT